MHTCICHNPPFKAVSFQINSLGSDHNFADITQEMCNKCGQGWIKYFLEDEGFSNSGRWWRVPFSDACPSFSEAKSFIEKQTWCWVGGSYYDSAAGGIKIDAPILIK